MQTFNNLPLYVFDVDKAAPDEGVEFVALVDKPAIKKNFMAFRDESQRVAFTITSEDRRIVSGPLMLADTPIYRKPPEVPEECYVTFPPATIEKIVHKFFGNGNQGNVNLMHDASQQVDGLTMFESFISDSTRGVMPMKGFEDAPEGSWFGSFIVNNEDVWASIKDGTFKGFSVEGIFAYSAPAQWEDVEFSEGDTEADRELLTGIMGILGNIE